MDRRQLTLRESEGPEANESDLPPTAYSSLKQAWQGYKIALANENIEEAKQFAAVINGIRAGHGLKPIEFTALDGFKGVDLNEASKHLCQPFGDAHTVRETPRPLPEVKATDHRGNSVTLNTDGSAVLYAFPRVGGCRCTAQVMQYDALTETGANVYGIAPGTPEELAGIVEKYNVNHTLISDPHGKIAARLGIKVSDGVPERTTLFVKKGKVVDQVEGMHGVKTQDGIELGEQPQILNEIQHPSVVTVLGKRGSGKSSTAYWVGEQMHRHLGVTPTTVAVPEHVHAMFPNEWVHVEKIQDSPPDSVVVVDEAYRMMHAREWQKNDSVEISKLINLSRQCDRTILFVSQSSKQVDGNIPLESDMVLVKEPGALHSQFERREMRPIIEQAEGAFDTIPGGDDLRGYAYSVSDEGTGMVRTKEAEFFTDSLSNAFGGTCREWSR